MKRYISFILCALVLSSTTLGLNTSTSGTYEVKIKLDSYEGIRPGTKIIYKSWDAGKVKSITEDNGGKYIVALIIYNDIKDIDSSYLFKVVGTKLIVDFEGMKDRELNKESEKLAKIEAQKIRKKNKISRELADKKAKELAEKNRVAKNLADKKAKELAEKNRVAKNLADKKAKELAEKNRVAKNLADKKVKEKEEKIAKELEVAKRKANEIANKKAKQLAEKKKTYSISDPFNGDINKIKKFQEENNLLSDGIWGPASQKVYDKLIADEEEKELEKTKRKAIEIANKKAKGLAEKKRKDKALADKKAKEIVEYEEEINKFAKLYDKAPSLRKKLKIKSNNGIKNSTFIKFYITKRGRTKGASVYKTSGDIDDDKAAILAIKKSRWNPAKKKSEKIGAWHILEVKF